MLINLNDKEVEVILKGLGLLTETTPYLPLELVHHYKIRDEKDIKSIVDKIKAKKAEDDELVESFKGIDLEEPWIGW